MRALLRKKIYKSLTFFSCALTFSSMALFATSCGSPKRNIISLITNNDQLNDNSQNQILFKAMEKFQSNSKKDGIPKYYANYSSPSGVPKKYEMNNSKAYNESYTEAVESGTKTLVLSGSEQENIGKISQFALKHKSNNFILVGNKINNSPLNLKTISFNYVQSGFEAAVYTGIFFNKSKEITNSTINVATFGRTETYDSLSYMDGFQQGVNYFNNNIAKPSKLKELVLSYANGKSPSEKDFIVNYDYRDKENQKVKDVVDGYLKQSNYVQVFFPINETQANIALSEIQNNLIIDPTKKAWVIGNNYDLTKSDSGNGVLTSTMLNFEKPLMNSLNSLYKINKTKWNNEILSYNNASQYFQFKKGNIKGGDKINVLKTNEWKQFISSKLFLNCVLQKNNNTFGSLWIK